MGRGRRGASWWVTVLECARAPDSQCSRRSLRAAQTDSGARAARDRSGSARRRQDNAAGAGNDGGEHEEGTSLTTTKTRGIVGEISAPNTMKQARGEEPMKLFTFFCGFCVQIQG